MESRNPYFNRRHCNPSEKIFRNRMYGNEQLAMEQSTNKRRLMDESDLYENKRRCDNNSWTASTSSSTKNNKDARYMDTNWKYKEKTSSNTLEKSHNTTFDNFQNSYPHRLISLMYQLELSTLFLLRKSIFTNSTEPAIFKNSKLGQFNNIIQCYNGEYFCIRVQYVDTYFIKKSLNGNSLISNIGDFALTNYLNEFAMELICYLDQLTDAPKYLIIYTNCAFDLTDDKKLKQIDTSDNNLIKLQNINSETDPDLMNLLKINNSTGEFYRFSNDERTRNKLHYFIHFSKLLRNKIGMAGLKQPVIKRLFFDRLIFAVNQPEIGELFQTVRNEIRSENQDLNVIRKEIIEQLSEDEIENSQNLINTFYSFELFIFSLHEMFLYENIHGVKFDEKNETQNIAMNSRNNFLYFKPLELTIRKNEDFLKQAQIFFINTLFSFFIQLDKNIDYFIIFTNGSLTLVKELILGKKFEANIEEELIHCLKFSRLNTLEEKYLTFRHSFLDVNNLYQFSHGDTRKIIFDLLTIPQDQFSDIDLYNLKEMFLDKIVFAVRQYNSEEFSKVLQKEIADKQIDLNYLYKIGFNYLKSHDPVPITKGGIANFDDLKNRNHLFYEEIELAKRVISVIDAPEFGKFVNFLTKGEGKICLDILKRNEIKIIDMLNIIKGVNIEEVEKIFLDLYNLWFDKEGNKTKLLKIFEGQEFYVNNMKIMLKGSGEKCSEIIIKLYSLWFDNFGNPTKYLRLLQMEGVNLSHISVLLTESRLNSVEKFKKLYSLWFNEDDTKTQQLRILEKHGINLSIICGVLRKSCDSFQKLYDLWFWKSGQKTLYLRKLEEAGVNLKQICSVIKGKESSAEESFRRLYELWFDIEGRKKIYLLTLENEGVKLASIFNILVETGCHVGSIFKKLYQHWFHINGDKTVFLQNLEDKGKSLSDVCQLLNGEGRFAVEKFRKICDSISSDSPVNRLIQNSIYNQTRKLNIYRENFNLQEKRGNEIIDLVEDREKNFVEETRQEFFVKNFENKSNQFPVRNDYEKAGTSKSNIEEKFFGNFRNQEREKSNYTQVFGNNYQEKEGCSNSQEKFPNFVYRNPEINSNNQERFSLNDFEDDGKLNISQERLTAGRNFDYKTGPEKNPTSSERFEMRVENEFSIFRNAETNANEFVERESLDSNEDNFEEEFERDLPIENTLEHNICSFFKLMPDWRRSTRNKFKWQRIIRDTLSIINDPQALTSLLEVKLTKKKINQREFQDMLTINSHAPFTISQLEKHLEGIKNSSAAAKHRWEGRFAKIIYNEYSQEFTEMVNLLLTKQGKRYINLILGNKMLPQHVARVLQGCSTPNEIMEKLEEFCTFFYEKNGQAGSHLRNLRKIKFNIRILLFIISGSGTQAIDAFEKLYNLWFHSNGQKTLYLTIFQRNDISVIDLCTVFENSGSNAAEIYQEFFQLCFNLSGEKSRYLSKYEEDGINIQILMRILKNSGTKTCQVFRELYNCLFDTRGSKTVRLQNLEKNGINLLLIANILARQGRKAPQAFDDLYQFVFNEHDSKQNHIKILEKELNIDEIFQIICGHVTNVKSFKELYDLWFDSRGKKTKCLLALEENGVNLKCLSGVLRGTGACAYIMFNNVFSFFFNNECRKTITLTNMEKFIKLRAILEIVSGAKNNVFEVLKKLYYHFIEGNGGKTKNIIFLENYGITFKDLSRILHGSGTGSLEMFKRILEDPSKNY
ncbi:uncharacterized protein LOC127286669 isoform X2 [Leptopilina boulardi]|uniref:uncharacterized protein LOC127286669 isoform X2 n=1 Tax=Leptopilina boulardi TaxID=63433 RepID=UPI0021F61653|nr:uncharacterized protein LOC127286669 isoform X2 [Leptopilina boulardi]